MKIHLLFALSLLKWLFDSADGGKARRGTFSLINTRPVKYSATQWIEKNLWENKSVMRTEMRRDLSIDKRMMRRRRSIQEQALNDQQDSSWPVETQEIRQSMKIWGPEIGWSESGNNCGHNTNSPFPKYRRQSIEWLIVPLFPFKCKSAVPEVRVCACVLSKPQGDLRCARTHELFHLREGDCNMTKQFASIIFWSKSRSLYRQILAWDWRFPSKVSKSRSGFLDFLILD